MIGKTISNYKILEKLGEGNMGKVYLAEDTKLKRNIALKFLPKDFSRDPDAKERFINEARSASSLDHNNVCVIHDIGETDDGQLFISMNYYKGKTLQEKLQEGRFSEKETLNYITQIAQGLESAHKKGIVHSDIKPANILITDEEIPKILDFGIAKVCCEIKPIIKDSTSGTIAYMSPEQISNANIDNRSDIWSLGIIFYEMLTKIIPFRDIYNDALMYSIMNEEPVSITSINPDVSPELEKIVLKMLKKNPDERYQYLIDLIVALDHIKKNSDNGNSGTQKSSIPIIAVLPFTNMSSDKDQDYFCSGIAEDVLNDLTRLDGLRVVARSSSFALKNNHHDVRGIGIKLGADTLVVGSVQKMGNRLRITAQLINISDGINLWSKKYDRELVDVFAIQDEISSSIVDALKIKLSNEEKSVLGKVNTKDILAYDYYLKGREYFHKVRRTSMEYASKMFSRAIEEDPNYALAYAGLADCYSYLFMYFESSQEELERAVSASEKALVLDQNLAEAHTARGLAISLNLQYEEAEKEFDIAIELNPKLYEAYYFYARTCRQQSNYKKAAELFEKASAIRPEDYQSPLLAVAAYRNLNLIDKAKKTAHRSLILAERHLQLNPDDARALYLGGSALAELGEVDKAIAWCKRAIAIDPNDPAVLFNAACIYSLSGKNNKALDCLEKAIDSGFASKEWIETDTDLDPIRNTPRFKRIMEKLL